MAYRGLLEEIGLIQGWTGFQPDVVASEGELTWTGCTEKSPEDVKLRNLGVIFNLTYDFLK